MKLKRTFAIELIAALFIFLFIYTALSKFYDFKNFRMVLGQSPLIGKLNLLIAWLLPLSELITALLLFIPGTKLAGFYASLILMSVFTFYIGYMLLFSPHLPCSCGGVIRQLTWRQHLLFNIFFVIMAGLGIRLYRSQRNHQPNFLLQ
jgi:hypothetical protein